jgi:hypothetical protein
MHEIARERDEDGLCNNPKFSFFIKENKFIIILVVCFHDLYQFDLSTAGLQPTSELNQLAATQSTAAALLGCRVADRQK